MLMLDEQNRGISMYNPNAVHSLTDFKRHTSDFVKKLRESHQPLILTVNGKAELVVQTTDNYRQMLDEMEKIQAIESIRRGLQSMKSGNGRAAAEVFDELESKYPYLRNP
jgi:prevent-host-death family protein